MDRLDKFYTKKAIVEKCISVLELDKYEVIVEPSAGSGAFLEFLPNNKTVALDIEPDNLSITKMDFFDTKPNPQYTYLVIGNPPFGKNSSLAKRFFNHAATFAKTIAFIVPRTFRKVSTTNQLCLHYHKTHEIVLPIDAFELPDGTPYSVPSVFQVWERKSPQRQKAILPSEHADFTFLSAKDYNIKSKASITVKLGEKEHTFDFDIEKWEQLKTLEKELPSCLFSSYKTRRVKRDIAWSTKPDFVIRRAGSQAGRLDYDYENKAIEGNYFIKTHHPKVVDIFQKMWDNWWCEKKDKDKLSVKWDTAGQACLSKSEVIQHYERMKEQMNEQEE